ncbi:MAG TPA: Ig-like domain-containing protein, partial [Gemmataceae bacterium]|nr:Ig-like domain-containing protein [Gemmataceae bacterium]
MQLTLTALRGVLAVAAGGSVTVAGNNTGSLTLTGPQPALNTLLTSLTYRPAADYFGPDTIAATVSDLGNTGQGGALTATGSTVVTVTPVNDAPVGTPDAYSTAEDTLLTVPVSGVLGNDTDVDGPALSAVLVGGPSFGTLTLNSDGSFTYTPALNYNGPDSFTYRASDGSLPSAVTTVSLTVTPVNDAPAVQPLVASIPETGSSDFDLRDYVADVETPDAQLVFAVGGATNGAVALIDGHIARFTPAGPGPASFGYTVTDTGDGPSPTITVGPVTAQLMVDEANASPITTPDTATAAEDGSVVVDVKANDLPGPAGESWQTLTVTAVAQPAHGTATILADGTVRYTPAPNWYGTDTFTYTVTDNGTTNGQPDPKSAVGTVTITVTPVADPPAAAADSLTVAEDAPVTTVDVLANDSDPDNLTGSANAGLTVVSTTAAAHGTVAVAADGRSLTYKPAADYHGPDSFTYTIQDPTGNTATATVSVTVTPVNDAPVAVNGSAATAEDTALTVDLRPLVTDIDTPAANLTYSIVGNPTRGTLAATATAGVYTYTPAGDYNGADAFTFRANDGALNSNTATVSLTVTPVNDAPVLDPIGNRAVNEQTPLTFTATATDVDAGQTRTFSLVGAPAGAAIDPATGAFAWTPTEAQGPGTFTFTVRVTDDGTPALSDEEAITVTVAEVNRAPALAPIPAQTVVATQPLTFTAVASDPDLPANGLTFSLVGAPGWAGIDPETGVFTGAPPAAGGFDFFVRVTDTGSPALSADQPVHVSVTPNNRAPTDVTLAPNTVAENAAVGTPVGTLAAVDPDPGDTHTFVLVPGEVDNSSFTIDGTTLKTAAVFDFEARSGYTVRVRATDAGGLSVEKDLAVTVTNVNEAPTLTITSATVDGFEALAAGNDGTFGDPDVADPVTVTASLGTVTQSGPTWTWAYTPPDDIAGETVTVTATDAAGLTATRTFTLTAANRPPVATDDAPTTVQNTPVEFNVLANDTDPAGANDPLTVTGFTQPAHGAVTQTTGGLRYTPATGYIGSDTFTYTISDGDGGQATGTVTVTVLAPSNPPTDVSLSAGSMAENQAAGSLVGSFTAADPDPGDTHTFALAAGAGDADNAAFTIADGQLRTAVVLNRETKAGLSIRVRATDSVGLWFEKVIALTVTDAPEPAAASGTVGGVSWAFNGTADTVTVTGRSAADTISFETAAGPAGPVLVLKANGSAIPFDGLAGRPAVYAHPWNHMQLLTVNALGGADTVTLGTAGVPLLRTAYERALVDGADGNNTLVGGAGPDSLRGGTGTDDYDGRGGSDTYLMTGPAGRLDRFHDSGDDGTDTLKNDGALPLDLNGFAPANGIDVIDGSGQAVRGDAAANTLDFRAARLVDVTFVDGLDGGDTIYASDLPVANAGAPFEGYFGDAGADRLYGGASADLLFGEAGTDALYGGGGADTLGGGAGTDALDGQAGADTYAVIGAEGRADAMTDTGPAGEADRLKAYGGPYLGAATLPLDLVAFSSTNGIEVVDGSGQPVRGDTSGSTLDFRAARLVDVRSVDGQDGADAIYASDLPVVNAGAPFAGYRGGGGRDSLYGGSADD